MRTKKRSITIILIALLFVVVQFAVVLPGTALASDDVILDFGSAGTWVLYDGADWSKLHSGTPKSITTGDLDGNGQDEAIIDFGASGVWIRMNDSSWTKLHPSNPDAIVTGDMDGNGLDEVIIDFAASGVWIWQNNTSWTKLHPSNPETITTGDIDGNGLDEVIINFGAGGVWIWQNNVSWTKLHPSNSDAIATGNMDGDGDDNDEVIIDFGASGIWVWKNNTSWTKLHQMSSEIIKTGDLDGNGEDDVVFDFGFGIGIWARMNDTAWEKLHSLTTELIEVGDVDGNGKDDIMMDFGPAYGLWARYDSNQWKQLHKLSPDLMSCGNMNGSLKIVMGGPPALEFTPVEGGSVSGNISAASGGTLSAASMRLEIPAGALSEDTMISMTVYQDTSQGDYALMGMFEPDGLVLNKPATLVIPLDPPLPPGSSINLLMGDSSNPSEVIDTGLLAEVSEDRTEVRIEILHFSVEACKLNCHGHSVRNIVKALLTKRGMTKEQIITEVKATVKDLFSSAELKELEENYDKLSDFKSCPAPDKELLAYLNTYYNLATVRLNAEYSNNAATSFDATSEECLNNLADLTKSSDLPPILNFGKQFTVVSPDGEPVFFKKVAHSAPLIERRNGAVVIENGTVLDKEVAIALQRARINHPNYSDEEIYRVITTDLNELDYLRALKSGEGVSAELQRWDADVTGLNLPIYDNINPWAVVRVWLPKGANVGLCDPEGHFYQTDTSLRAIWGWPDNNVITAGYYNNTVGGYKIYRYDGTAWTESVMKLASGANVPNHGYISDFWGTSPNDVYGVTVGDGYNSDWGYYYRGKLLHYNGSNWAVLSDIPDYEGGSFTSIWGSGPSNIYATGMDHGVTPYVGHFNGSIWSGDDLSLALNYESYASDIHGNALGDVYIAGDWGIPKLFFTDNGPVWTESGPTFSTQWQGIWVAPDRHVFVVGYSSWIGHFDGTSWEKMDVSHLLTDFTYASFNKVWGRSSTDVYAVGRALLHYDGTSWSRLSPPEEAPNFYGSGVWGSQTGDMFVVGNGGILRISKQSL